MERGYVKLWRSIEENELLENDNTAYIVFTKLLTRVNRKNGTYITGRNRLANVCNINPNTLYSALKRLEASTMIQQHSNSSSTTITICNWWKYQQDVNNASTARRVAVNTKQEREKEREYIDTNVSMAVKPRKQISSDIDRAFETWEQIMGYPLQAQKQKNRNAASNLIKSNGIDKLRASLEVVKACNLDKYHGVRTSDFIEMQYNLNKISRWKADYGQHIDTGKQKQVADIGA